jgi:quinol monooxygenase YgiN
MSVVVLWEAKFGRDHTEEGQAVIKRIWDDMSQFAGYVDHETIVDVSDPGHVVVISHWASREAADRVLAEYRNHPNAVQANRLAVEPRRRTLGVIIDTAAKAA